MDKIVLTWDEFITQVHLLALKMKEIKEIENIVPVLSGGSVPAVTLSCILKIPLSDKITSKNSVIVDEIVDTGNTLEKWKNKYPENIFICLHFNKARFSKNIEPDIYFKKFFFNGWIIYPWEKEYILYIEGKKHYETFHERNF